MRRVWTALGLVGFLVGAAEPGRAQVIEDDPALSAQPIGSGFLIFEPSALTNLQARAELTRWIHEASKWIEWRDEWLNTREQGWFRIRDRKQKPDPPSWLFEECNPLWQQDDVLLVEACRILSNWNDDLATSRLRRELSAEREQREAPTKTAWWQHVHVDALWPMTQWRASVYGVVGMHATMEVAGRFQVFIAPGIILLSMPAPGGDREWKPATDWGFAFRLFDFKFPVGNRPASLHLNIARAWVFANAGSVPFDSSINLAGFSVTFKPVP
jgi:hypothetical protein